MNLDEQIQLLIDDAPQDGVTPQVVAAIAPGLKLLAEKLRHSQYYILQSMDSDWVVTTLSNRTNPDVEKRVIYAFPTLKDIPVVSTTELEADLIAIPLPVTHILFQLTALETVDSIIFFETPNDLTTGIEIQREDIQNLIEVQLKQNPPASSNSLASYRLILLEFSCKLSAFKYPSSVKLGKLKWLKRLPNKNLSVFVNFKNDRKCQSL